MKSIAKILFVSFILFSNNSCDKIDSKSIKPFLHDSEIGLSKTDFKDSLTDGQKRSKLGTKKSKKEIKLPEIFQYPEIPDISDGKLVSIKVTEDIPLKDVLIELARLAEIEIEIDPYISGGVIIIAKNRPFISIVKQISELASLRYSVNEGILRIERDIPYLKNYTLDFLDLERDFSSSLSVSTSTSTDEISSGGESSLSSTSDSSIWSSVQEDIDMMLMTEESEDSETFITINKKAGILSISATEKQHRKISTYINKVKQNITAQVLIEAKILEVTLDEKFETGINWSELTSNNYSGTFSNMSQTSNVFSLGISNKSTNNNLAGTFQFIESFGTTRTLSSPRITALNNQQSILTFTKNQVYFEVDVDNTSTTTDGGGTSTNITVESELKTVPIGIILSLLPSINLETNEVTMNIRPTISSSSSSVSDPAVDIAAAEANSANISSNIPEVQLKEIDTMLKLKSGEAMVIGGLMEHNNNNETAGVPWLKNIPLLGYLFKAKTTGSQIKETVIFIKATIIDSEPTIHESDRSFYNIFSKDPHNLGI